MPNFAIGWLLPSRLTLCPYVQYEGTYASAVAMYRQFDPPLHEDELYISPVTQALETAFEKHAGRLVIVGGTYNDAKRVFVADFIKEMPDA